MRASIAAKCKDCMTGPTGIAGHDTLFLAAGGFKSTAIFSCTACRAFWSRTYHGSGEFRWEALLETSPTRQLAEKP